jgi:amidase
MDFLNLLAASASDLQSLLASGQITSVSLINQCLAQIEKHDRKPGSAELRAMMFVTKREKLIGVAAALDEERKLGKVRGSLHGIPIVLKVC